MIKLYFYIYNCVHYDYNTIIFRKLHGSSIDVDVFEKTDQCGGRLKTVDINGQKTEAGGTYILSSHRYTMEFFQQTGLRKKKNGKILLFYFIFLYIYSKKFVKLKLKNI